MSVPTVNPAELVMPSYEREYGIHIFPMQEGQNEAGQSPTITVVSQPTWESFFYALRTAAPRSLGQVALGPELMTSPGPVNAVPAQREKIGHRIGMMRRLSEDHPGTTFVFGTATFDNSENGARYRRPANSALFVKKGEVVAQTNKQYPSLTVEKDVFTFEQEEGERTDDPSIAALVCADIIGEGGSDQTKEMLLSGLGGSAGTDRLVGDEVTTVLLSSNWAHPMRGAPSADMFTMPDERFRQALEIRVGRLFQARPNVREVIVADRVADIEGIKGPYNARFTSRVKQPQP